jgi:hypothetical protein
MLRAISFGLVCLFIVSMPKVGHAQKKAQNGPPPTAQPGTPEEYALLNKQKDVQGKLVTRDVDLGPEVKAKKSLTIRYEYEVTDVNPNYKPTKVAKPHDFTKEIQNLQMKQVKAMQIQNPQKQAMTLQQLAVEMQNLQGRINMEQAAQFQREAAAKENDVRNNNVPYIKVMRAKEFELEIQENVVIRRLKPALEYNDKGFLKEYTKEELEKLHLVDNADKKKPGYPAKYDDLLPKQTITVYLTPGKKIEKTDKMEKKDAPGDKADPADPFIPLRPTVNMIVIVEDIPDPNGAMELKLPPTKKKKKD